ncbi:MAG TPA: guanylate kinase [Candidatus Hydrogenedentes bacterium]|nr:guanylate kinase [Candidatus Hydrogenedentota bacterium]HOL78138.1 guanylate kinase [Candidatus Hydrogenedentota bacterium]HPO85573.1 guanylate kinase [Candidatus Hydrogenedentota bacterium]
MQKNGKIFIISGPSGSGKHAIIKELIDKDPRLVLSISATTRPARPGEVNGKDYYFLSQEEFSKKIENNEFVEWAQVHGYRYGTLRAELLRHIESGKDVILQVDVQGMRGLKQADLDTITIFIVPPSLEELRKRLNKRGTESEEALAIRLANAQHELNAQRDYDYIVVNDVLPKAVEEVQRIIEETRH